jgi:ABC-type phosphonate transport system ATPase subunit
MRQSRELENASGISHIIHPKVFQGGIQSRFNILRDVVTVPKLCGNEEF